MAKNWKYIIYKNEGNAIRNCSLRNRQKGGKFVVKEVPGGFALYNVTFCDPEELANARTVWPYLLKELI